MIWVIERFDGEWRPTHTVSTSEVEARRYLQFWQTPVGNPVRLVRATMEELLDHWRCEASLGATFERGKGRDEAMAYCADELAAALSGHEKTEGTDAD